MSREFWFYIGLNALFWFSVYGLRKLHKWLIRRTDSNFIAGITVAVIALGLIYGIWFLGRYDYIDTDGCVGYCGCG